MLRRFCRSTKTAEPSRENARKAVAGPMPLTGLSGKKLQHVQKQHRKKASSYLFVPSAGGL